MSNILIKINYILFSDILRQRTRNVQVKQYCINLLEKLGSFQYTRNVLASLDQEARAEVANLSPNPIMQAVLNDLLTWKTCEV